MSRSWAKGSTRAWRRTRAAVLTRDGHRCQLRLDGCTRHGATSTYGTGAPDLRHGATPPSQGPGAPNGADAPGPPKRIHLARCRVCGTDCVTADDVGPIHPLCTPP